jgi:hypothetical protein
VAPGLTSATNPIFKNASSHSILKPKKLNFNFKLKPQVPSGLVTLEGLLSSPTPPPSSYSAFTCLEIGTITFG